MMVEWEWLDELAVDVRIDSDQKGVSFQKNCLIRRKDEGCACWRGQ